MILLLQLQYFVLGVFFGPTSSPTRDKPMPPEMEAQSLNYWTAREVPTITVYILYLHLLQDINQE